jgi:thiamine monophosphate synthase
MMPPLWVITDAEASMQRGMLVVLARALAHQAPVSLAVVLRAKALDHHRYQTLAVAVAHICRRASVTLLLHNHPSLVGAVGAAGCHLSSDASVPQRRLARLRMPPGAWLSMSMHEHDPLPTNVDGVLWGPFHAPLSKQASNIIAGDRITPAMPTWVVGGMTPARWAPVRDRFAGVATIGSIMSAASPARALQQWAEVTS